MTTLPKDTESIILDAARKIFVQNGYDGTTMQMISDEAGINKALLHYYYRNKDTLFEGVFVEAFKKVIPHLQQFLLSEADLFIKLGEFVDSYISTLQQVPEVPLFILHELHRNPERMVQLVSESGIDPRAFITMIEREVEAGTIRETDPLQLMVNMLAMCIFPFAARPIIQGFIMNDSEETFMQFLEKRKTEVTTFIINAIKK